MTMDDLLREAVMRKASDLHITIGVPPILRINGSLKHMDYPALMPQDTDRLLSEITSPEQRDNFYQSGELDASYALAQVSRFRVNAFRQRGATALVLRVIAEKVPTMDQLGHP